MNNYEITFLLEDSKHTETIKKVIVELAGKVIEEKHWGKQSLVYPINKILVADYFTWKIQLAKDKLSGLKKTLNFDNHIIRFLLLKKEES